MATEVPRLKPFGEVLDCGGVGFRQEEPIDRLGDAVEVVTQLVDGNGADRLLDRDDALDPRARGARKLRRQEDLLRLPLGNCRIVCSS